MSFQRTLPGSAGGILRAVAAGVVLLLAAPAGFAQSDPLHLWAGKLERAAVEKWVGDRLTREQHYVDELMAVKGHGRWRTPCGRSTTRRMS